MTETHDDPIVLRCFGSYEAVAGLYFFQNRPLDPIEEASSLVKNGSALVQGRITITGASSRLGLSRHRPERLAFFVQSRRLGLGLQLFGIDTDLVPRLYVEMERMSARPHVLEVVALTNREPLRGGSPSALEREVERLFLEHVNPHTEDPLLDPHMLEGAPASFAPGIDEDALFTMAEAALTIAMEPGTRFAAMTILSGAGTEDAAILDLVPRVTREGGALLLQAVLDVCRPVGWSYVYNEGPRLRASGYDLRRCRYEIEAHDISALSQVEAWERLAPLLDRRLPNNDPCRRRFLGQRSLQSA